MGCRPTTRYEEISVAYRDVVESKNNSFVQLSFRPRSCQHEMDHLEGIIIKMKDGVDSAPFLLGKEK